MLPVVLETGQSSGHDCIGKKNVSTYVHRRAFALSRSHPFLSVANLAGLGKKDYYWSVPVRQGLDWSKADGTSCLVFYLPSV